MGRLRLLGLIMSSKRSSFEFTNPPCQMRSCILELTTPSPYSLENLAGTGFEPQSSGSYALSVPSKASVVDNKDSAIAYGGEWTPDGDVQYYGSSLTGTRRPEDYFTYTFSGTGIW